MCCAAVDPFAQSISSDSWSCAGRCPHLEERIVFGHEDGALEIRRQMAVADQRCTPRLLPLLVLRRRDSMLRGRRIRRRERPDVRQREIQSTWAGKPGGEHAGHDVSVRLITDDDRGARQLRLVVDGWPFMMASIVA